MERMTPSRGALRSDVGQGGSAVPVLDRVIDVDAHEMAPTHVWGDLFGDHNANMAERLGPFLASLGELNGPVVPGIADDAPITAESVWTTKGPMAPGAFDFERRLDVLDTMGTRRQLVFPTAALIAFNGLTSGETARTLVGLTGPDDDRMLAGVIDEYNNWALRTTTSHPERYRAAALVVAKNVDELMERVGALLDRGARALWLPSTPVAGRSPADPDLDAFWSMLEEAEVAVALHIGTEDGFRRTEQWREAPAFSVGKTESTEIHLEPFSTSTFHMVPETFLTAMVLGGVFERHPRLRFGVIELRRQLVWTDGRELGPLRHQGPPQTSIGRPEHAAVGISGAQRASNALLLRAH